MSVVEMNADSAIFTAIDSILSLVNPGTFIFTSIEVSVYSKKKFDKRKHRLVHFLFTKSRAYTAVYWATTDKNIIDPKQIEIWIRSANNDGFEVVGSQGIGGPIDNTARQLLQEFHKNADPQKYKMEASWLLGQPEVVEIGKMSKTSEEKNDHIYRIEVV